MQSKLPFIYVHSSEVRAAEQRAVAFAERLWTDRFLNVDLELKNLMNTRIISGLTRWLFNALSRYLMPFKMADRKGMERAVFRIAWHSTLHHTASYNIKLQSTQQNTSTHNSKSHHMLTLITSFIRFLRLSISLLCISYILS